MSCQLDQCKKNVVGLSVLNLVDSVQNEIPTPPISIK